MLLEIGKGYGSVSLVPNHPYITRIKVYSTIAHAIKATSQKDMQSAPTTHTTFNNRYSILDRKLNILETSNHAQMCGLRFEVTIYARTEQDARLIAEDSGYLHPSKYLQPTEEEIALEFLAVPTKDYFLYNNKMRIKLSRVKTEISQRHGNSTALLPHHKAAIIDFANALGWNGGRGLRPTNIDRRKVPNPWWDNCMSLPFSPPPSPTS